MSFMKNRRMARENMGEADVLNVVEPVEESVEAQVGEVDKDDQEVYALLNEGEVLEQDTETLEKMEDQVEDIEEDGEEITPEHAETLQIATESIARRWSLGKASTRKLAFESFSGRRGDTKLVRESIKDRLADMWKTFIEWLSEMVDKMIDTFKKYVNAGKSMQSRAKKNAKILDKLGTKSKDKIKGSFVTKLSIEGKYDAKKAIQLALSIDGKAKSALAASEKFVDAAGELVKIATTQDSDSAKFNRVTDGEKTRELFGEKVSKKLQALGGKDSGESQTVYALPGNGYLQSSSYEYKPREDSAVKAQIVAVRLHPGEDSTEEKEIDTPTVAVLEECNDAMEDIGKAFEKVEQGFTKTRNGLKKLMDEAKKAEKAVGKAEKGEAKDQARVAQKVAREAATSAQHTSKAVTYVYKTVGAGLSGLVNAGIAAYKKDA